MSVVDPAIRQTSKPTTAPRVGLKRVRQISQSFAATTSAEPLAPVCKRGRPGPARTSVYAKLGPDRFYTLLNLAVCHFLTPKDLLVVRCVSREWRRRLNNTPLLLSACWEALPFSDYWNLRKAEMRAPIRPGTVGTLSPELTPRMLHRLFLWMSILARDFGYSLQTHFSAANIVYRILAHQRVARQHLQLLGMIGLLLGASFHERAPPRVSECVELCAGLYVAEDVCATEVSIFQALGWKVNRPNVYTVVMLVLTSRRFAVNPRARRPAAFLCELTLTDFELASEMPTKLGLVVVCAALYALGLSVRRVLMVSGYNPINLRATAEKLIACVVRASAPKNASPLTNDIIHRYSSPNYECVAPRLLGLEPYAAPKSDGDSDDTNCEARPDRPALAGKNVMKREKGSVGGRLCTLDDDGFIEIFQ